MLTNTGATTPHGNARAAYSTPSNFGHGCTQMDADDFGLNQLSERIIGCAFRVLNTLGPGILEKVYENALAHELRKFGMDATQQHGIAVYYDGIIVGQYAADLLVENTVLIELKTTRTLDNAHTAQCINHLKATRLPLCLLLNFGRPRMELRRLINTPDLP
jgi:GxxExxY protein